MIEVDPQRWGRVRPLFDRALDLQGQARLDFVAGLTGPDAELRQELERLLEEHARNEDSPSLVPADFVTPLLARGLRDDATIDAERVGQFIGVFRLVRLIGTGGMGAVYLAERSDENFTQEVAIKVIRHTVASAVARERFEQERQILAGLTHPNIAKLLDGGQTPDGQPYYTMEYVAGVPITDYCQDHKLSVESRIRLLLKVASALAYAHQHLVVHRDIKPSNILVKADGQVMLLDFGIAKLVGESAQKTVTLAAIGPMTPEYAAPEQFRNAKITLATDVYQIGALCYRVLTERLPYQADPADSYAWAKAVAEDDPITLRRTLTDGQTSTGLGARRLTRLRRRVAGDLDAILRKAMAKSPAERYQSMDALAADLNRFLEGRPVSARQMGAVYYAWRFVTRRPLASAAVLLAAIGLMVTTLIAVRQADLKAHEAERANSEAKRATAVADFLIGLFQDSDPGTNKGDKLTANQILERGAERMNNELAGEPEQRARLQVVIGQVYTNLTEYSRAKQPLQDAADTLRKLQGADPVELGHALRYLSWIFYSEGDYPTALRHLDSAQVVLAKFSDPNALQEISAVLSTRSMVHLGEGNLSAALDEQRESIALIQQAGMGESGDAATRYNNLGVLLRDLGRNKDAQSALEHALHIRRNLYGADDWRTLISEQTLGQVMLIQDDLDYAETLLKSTDEKLRRQFGDHSFYSARAQLAGELAIKRGSYDVAMDHLRTAERDYRSSMGDAHPFVAEAMVWMGRALIAKGDIATALQEQEKALTFRREIFPRDHIDVAESLVAVSEAQLLLGKFVVANENAEQAWLIYKAKLSIDHPDAIQSLYFLGLSRYAIGDAMGAKVAWNDALRGATLAYNADSKKSAELRLHIEDTESKLLPR